jgi:hypothetical protein
MAVIAGAILCGRFAEPFEVRGLAAPDCFFVNRRPATTLCPTSTTTPAANEGNGFITHAVWETHPTTPAEVGIDYWRRLLVPSVNSHSAITILLNGCERLL